MWRKQSLHFIAKFVKLNVTFYRFSLSSLQSQPVCESQVTQSQTTFKHIGPVFICLFIFALSFAIIGSSALTSNVSKILRYSFVCMEIPILCFCILLIAHRKFEYWIEQNRMKKNRKTNIAYWWFFCLFETWYYVFIRYCVIGMGYKSIPYSFDSSDIKREMYNVVFGICAALFIYGAIKWKHYYLWPSIESVVITIFLRVSWDENYVS